LEEQGWDFTPIKEGTITTGEICKSPSSPQDEAVMFKRKRYTLWCNLQDLLSIIKKHNIRSHQQLKARSQRLPNQISANQQQLRGDMPTNEANIQPLQILIKRNPTTGNGELSLSSQHITNALSGQLWELDFMDIHHDNSPAKKPILIAVSQVSGYVVAIPMDSKSESALINAGRTFTRMLNKEFPALLKALKIQSFDDPKAAMTLLASKIQNRPTLHRDNLNTVGRYIGIIQDRMNTIIGEIKSMHNIDLPGILHPKLLGHVIKNINNEQNTPNNKSVDKTQSIHNLFRYEFGTLVTTQNKKFCPSRNGNRI
jgi:hypothetical protein